MAEIKRETIEVLSIEDTVTELSKEEKLTLIKEYFQKEYQGKTVTYTLEDEEINPVINKKTRNKFLMRGSLENRQQYKARLNIGANNEFMTLIERAKYDSTKDEGKSEQSNFHRFTEKWHYFVKPIICDGEYYQVVVNVRENKDREMQVYGVTLSDLGDEIIEEVEKETSVSTPESVELDTRLSENNISDDQEDVNTKDEINATEVKEPEAQYGKEEIMDERAIKPTTLSDLGITMENIPKARDFKGISYGDGDENIKAYNEYNNVVKEGNLMTVNDLSKEELTELKQNYYQDYMDAKHGLSATYGELANIDDIIDDATILEAYKYHTFTKDDFFCNQEKEENEMAEDKTIMTKEGNIIAEMKTIDIAEENEAEKADQEKVYISLHKKFCVSMDDKFQEGKTFNIMNIPKGTMLNGKDIGGASITPLYMAENKFNPNEMTATYYVDKGQSLDIKLSYDDGSFEKVDVKELRDAVKEQKAQYKEQQKEQEQAKEQNKEQTKSAKKEKDAGAEL